jgi:hypothetical protein
MPWQQSFTVSMSNAMTSWRAWVPQRASSMGTTFPRHKATTRYTVKFGVI